jgi:hypothetical protein
MKHKGVPEGEDVVQPVIHSILAHRYVTLGFHCDIISLKNLVLNGVGAMI